jgi:lipopolysaccharide assembly outer membrane protein LptD (OstA)
LYSKSALKIFVLILLFIAGNVARGHEAPFFCIYESRDIALNANDTLSLQNASSQLQNDTIVPGNSQAPARVIPRAEQQPGEPDITDTPRSNNSSTILETRVDYSSNDSIFYDLKNQRVLLFGNASLVYGDIKVEADFVEIDFNKNELFATGLPDSLGQMQGFPVFTENDQTFQSKELRYNFQTKRGRTLGVITEEADGFLHGDVVKIQPNGIIHAQDGKYTTCDNPEPHFHICLQASQDNSR